MDGATIAVLGLGALALLSGDDAAASSSSSSALELGPGDAAGRAELVAVAGDMQVPDDWTAYLLMHARGESGFNIRTARGIRDGAPSDVRVSVSATEHERSAQAFDRNAALFAGSPHPRSRYVFGTGGWFGEMPANMLKAFDGSALLPDADPWLVFDQRASIVMLLAAADRIMHYPAFIDDPTFLRIRGAFRSLATMRDEEKLDARRPYYEAAAIAADVDPAILRARPSPLPTTSWSKWISFNPWGGA